jgi:hypothetical protein
MGSAQPQSRERAVAVRSDPRAIALVIQYARNQIANVLFVVDDKDFRRD